LTNKGRNDILILRAITANAQAKIDADGDEWRVMIPRPNPIMPQAPGTFLYCVPTSRLNCGKSIIDRLIIIEKDNDKEFEILETF